MNAKSLIAVGLSTLFPLAVTPADEGRARLEEIAPYMLGYAETPQALTLAGDDESAGVAVLSPEYVKVQP